MSRRQPDNRRLRVAVLGIGHELRGDDAAGVMAARRLRPSTNQNQIEWLIVEGGPAPENQTGKLRQFQPDLVVMVDAAQMNAPPGSVAWLDMAQIEGLSAVTHLLPLNILAGYLASELGCAVGMIGIQPAGNEMMAELSAGVATAVDQVCQHLTGLSTPDRSVNT